MPVGPVDGDDPGALAGVATLGDLVQVGLGEEAGVGHQALVHRAELVDAELGVGDEAAVPAALLLAQQQVAEHLLERGVAEPDVVDEPGGARPEQVGAQRVELQTLVGLGRRRRPSPGRGVPDVDQPEQHAQRAVQVRARAGLRARQLDLHQVAQPVQAVAGVVLWRAGREHAQLGGGLGVEQEQDPVEEPQRLLGQLVRVGRRKRLEAPRRGGGSPPRWR